MKKEIDENIKNLIELCNKKGFITKFSCSGIIKDHMPIKEKPNYLRFNIMFFKNLNDLKLNFLKKISKEDKYLLCESDNSISIINNDGISLKHNYSMYLDRFYDYDKILIEKINILYDKIDKYDENNLLIKK